MRRASLLLAGALTGTVLAFSAGAGAATTCTITSQNVVGQAVEGTLVSSDVDPSQASYATCAYAKKVMKQVTEARIEEQGSVAGFFCRIERVGRSLPPVLGYSCTFKGADTATFIKLTFSVKYRPTTSCTSSSSNVIGRTVKGTLSSRNVNPIQAQYATCAQAKKVMNRITSLRVEEPRATAGLYCVPAVLQMRPDRVRYTCTFKGADTPMFVKLVFTVTYNLD